MTAETLDKITDHQLEFVRDYNVSLDRLWTAVTTPDEIVKWFGPEGVRIENCDMDFTRTGPWFCIMVGRESGKIFKNTGVVTHSRPPKGGSEGSVGFTWAWHDEDDVRGPESHVMFEVSTHDDRARFRLIHRDLANSEASQSHSVGWLSVLGRLDAYLDN